jgi:hypothetical protein
MYVSHTVFLNVRSNVKFRVLIFFVIGSLQLKFWQDHTKVLTCLAVVETRVKVAQYSTNVQIIRRGCWESLKFF